MKILIYTFTFCILLFSTTSCANAQNNIEDKQAIQMLKQFYIAYNTAWSAPIPPEVLEKRLQTLQKKYCTIKLANEGKKAGIEHDQLINDLYTDVPHLKTLVISKDPVKTNVYIVSYIAPDNDASNNKPIETKVVIHVTLVKENGNYKIASVK